MASVIKSKTNTGTRYSIQLSPGESVARPKISLGKVTRKQTEAAKLNVEALASSRRTGTTISPSVQDWLDNLPELLRKRLETIGLVALRKGLRSYTVTDWVKRYIRVGQMLKSLQGENGEM